MPKGCAPSPCTSPIFSTPFELRNARTPFLHWSLATGAKCLCLVLALLAVSCASVSVDNLRRFAPSAPLKPPQEILISPFELQDDALRVDRVGEELERFKGDLQTHFTRELSKRLGKHIAPVRVLAPGETPPRGDFLLVSGKFLTVHQGSRLLRSTVGLGAGATKMETLVTVQDFSGETPQPILRFETTGGSNISQGIGGVVTAPFTGPMAFTSLFNAIDGARSGVTFDATRTSREITATISEHLHKSGVLKNKKRLVPKRAGEMPYLTP